MKDHLSVSWEKKMCIKLDRGREGNARARQACGFELASSSSGRNPGLGEGGGSGLGVRWAGMMASDRLPGQMGCGHRLGMVAAPWKTGSLGGWRDALS